MATCPKSLGRIYISPSESEAVRYLVSIHSHFFCWVVPWLTDFGETDPNTMESLARCTETRQGYVYVQCMHHHHNKLQEYGTLSLG